MADAFQVDDDVIVEGAQEAKPAIAAPVPQSQPVIVFK